MTRIISSETRIKMRNARLGRKFKGGWKLSKETRKKQSIAKKGFIPLAAIEMARIKNTGIKRSEIQIAGMRERNSGEKSHLWKGGVSKLPGYRAFLQRRREVRKSNNGGSHSILDWVALKREHKLMCLCCKKFEPEIKLTEDHIIPISKGGTDDISNIQPLCKSCNSIKNIKIVDFREAKGTIN